jgi:transcriptional regulator with XRE-family HTH domain
MPKLKRPDLTPQERSEIRQQILTELQSEEIHLGQAIRQLRLKFTGLNQKQFGRIAGFSATTISAIERDPETGTVKTLNKILRKFGMHLTIGMIVRNSEKS